MKEPILVVMAAGMGSRYGGLKQIDPVGKHGEIIIDFSLYDAFQAGFRKAVFIIKKEIEQDFKEVIGDRISKIMQVQYAYQQIDDLPAGYSVPEGRTKPWGTGQAVLSCRNVIDAPFAVINADDYYGREAFQKIYDFLKNADDNQFYQYAMVGYILENTLTENGHVARGVCTVENGILKNVVERTRIERKDGNAQYTEDGENWVTIKPNSTVSMNLWGFTPSILQELGLGFPDFLDSALKNNPLKAEYFLPTVVDNLIQKGKSSVQVLTSHDRWYGVTYRQDKPIVEKAIADLIEAGVYPQKLWEDRNKDKNTVPDEVLNSYYLGDELVGALPYGSGHINDTFAAYYQMKDGTAKRFVVQRINTNVFQNPEKLMQNISSVTDYLRERIIKSNGDPERETLNIIKTKDGKNYCYDSNGNCWRVYLFIEQATTYQQVEKPDDFYQSAAALGKFQQLLADFPAETLVETIPNFHNTRLRFQNFEQAVKKDIMNRAKDVQPEIEFVMNRKEDTGVLVDMLACGELPIRVTHNDTKLNNVMIDNATGEGICMIDLDTVMPGLSLYDFGDSIRFGASTAAEDEQDLSKVQMSLDLFEVFTKGYLKAAGAALTPNEKKMLPMGAKLMTLECGMRFLTDYLSGDTYFKIHREGHNLDRTRTQLKLVEDMEKKWALMQEIVEKYS